MKLVLLDAKTLGEDIVLGVFERFGDVDIYPVTPPEKRIERCKEADIVITNKVVIDKEVMDACEKLKLVCVAATGMNNVDLAYAAQKGIEVKNVAGYSTDSVVQHTFAMLFYLMEKLPYYDHHVKSKAWARSGIFTCIDRPFHELRGKQWGIIGLGTIGKAVAKVAEAFGATVVYHSTSGENDDPFYPPDGAGDAAGHLPHRLDPRPFERPDPESAGPAASAGDAKGCDPSQPRPRRHRQRS